jgi:PTS system mannose-specific IIA component
VVGPQEQIETISIGPDDDVEERRNAIIAAVERVDTGDGVAILSDMFGGTPSNLGISVMRRSGVELLAGLSLPMLVKIAKVRGDEVSLKEAVEAAKEAGQRYVTIASEVLNESEIKTRRTRPASDRTIAQRPAAFRFALRGYKIDALPEVPEVVDADVADSLYSELFNKANVLKRRLAETNSDKRVQDTIQRLIDALADRFDRVRPGVLLSRSRSVEADRNAFDSEEGRRELFPGAFSMLDDVWLSAQDLLAVYPIVRKIESERLALAIQQDQNLISEIRAETDQIKDAAAESSDAVTVNGVAALRENDPEINQARNLQVRTNVIADQLLVIRNFCSEVFRAVRDAGTDAGILMGHSLKVAGQELKTVGQDSWKQVRENLPIGVGKAARVLPLVALVGLLAKISMPVAGLATLVRGFKPIAKAIKEFQESPSRSNVRKKKRRKSKRRVGKNRKS